MNRKGGYKIVSCVSPTIYNDIEGNYGKPILLTDIVIGGVEKADAFVTFELNSTDFVAKVYDKWFVVSDDNTTSIDVELVLYEEDADNFDYNFEDGKNYIIKVASDNGTPSSSIAHCNVVADDTYLYTTLAVYDSVNETAKIATSIYYDNDKITFTDLNGDVITISDNDVITIYKI